MTSLTFFFFNFIENIFNYLYLDVNVLHIILYNYDDILAKI